MVDFDPFDPFELPERPRRGSHGRSANSPSYVDAEAHISPESQANEPRIVLGIDYGTTFTGLAWIQTRGNEDISVKDIALYQSWPVKESLKVPSAYSYSPSSSGQRCKQWGHDIDDQSQVMRWTKLELEPKTGLKELEQLRELTKGLGLVDQLFTGDEDIAVRNDVPRHLTKAPEDVLRDYLSKVLREWYMHMKAKGKHTLDNVPLDIIVTHPAAWSYEAMNKTYRAVRGAMPKSMFPTQRDISFISEPEACALYTVQDLIAKDHFPLISGECFVLCDAGGGTVDLASYRVDSVEPLKLVQVGGITGDKCGSTNVDRAFLEWLEQRLENLDILAKDFGTGGHFILKPIGRMLLGKFEVIKHDFNGTDGGDISLPRGTKVRADQETNGLDTGLISLSGDDVRAMFGSSVNGAVRLISRQVVQVETTPTHDGIPYNVTNIFLSGGFAENEHLFNEVKKHGDTRHIDVQRAEDCWAGVVKGAVLMGIGSGIQAPPTLKSCPRHYGIAVRGHYDRLDNTDRSNIIIWKVAKGDLLHPQNPIMTTLKVSCSFSNENMKSHSTIRITFIATAIDRPSHIYDNLSRSTNEVKHLEVNLRSIPKNSIVSRGHLGSSIDLDVDIIVSEAVSVLINCGSLTLDNYSCPL